jgi:quercetin dioxygenase-like cupin family protein
MISPLDLIGKYPEDVVQARKEKRFIHVPKEKMLHFIHGKENHVGVSFYFSTDRAHLGIMTIPANQSSDIEEHHGDEILFVLQGRLMMRTIGPETVLESVSQMATEVREGEKFLIPENVKHQYCNLSEKPLRILFVVAPSY